MDADERTVWWTLVRASVGAAATIGFDLRIEGAEHIPRRGGALLVFNHVSVLDIIVVGVPVVDAGRSIHTLGLAEDFQRPVLGWAFRRTEQVPLRRGLGDWEALHAVADLVVAGRLGAIAPEGTVGDGHALQEGQKGAARIALLAYAPIVPVGIWGTQRRWAREGIRLGGPLRPSAGVVFGEPIDAEGDPKHRPDVQALTDRIMAAIEELVTRARRLAPGAD
jgi:1-acyl-sn-glycerol-3-phosphate acyltransferase